MDDEPKHVEEGKASYRGAWYPKEDVEGTDMFRPFFLRRRTWLVVAGLAGLVSAALWLRPEVPADAGLDSGQVGIGIGIFICIAFLWLTEALTLLALVLF